MGLKTRGIRVGGAIATHSQQRWSADCSSLRECWPRECWSREYSGKLASLIDAGPQSRGAIRPSFARSFAQTERGRRECRVRAAPAVSCAKRAKKRTRAYRYRRSNPAFPAQWFDGLCRALPGDEFLFVTVASRIGGSSAPGRVDAAFARLSTSNGCQDHAVLPYAASPVVCTLCSLTDQSPPCDHHHAPDAACVHRIPPQRS
jgi:hypothetical protein